MVVQNAPSIYGRSGSYNRLSCAINKKVFFPYLCIFVAWNSLNVTPPGALKIPFFNHFETRYFTIVHVIRHLNQVNWMRFHSLFHLAAPNTNIRTFAFTGIQIQWSAIHNNVSSIFQPFVILDQVKPNESQSISFSMNRLYKMFLLF